MLYFLFFAIVDFCNLDLGFARLGISELKSAIFCFILGLRYSLVQNIHFDLQNKRFKTEYSVGLIQVGFWKPLPNIEYISVFKQGLKHDESGEHRGYKYNLNMWYTGNKHFTVYSSDEPEPVFLMAKFIARKLGVDLLDATVPNDFKWIENEEEPLSEDAIPQNIII